MTSREEAVALALAWKGTPYVTGARVCKGGCDCATFLSEYLIGIGAATEIPLFTYAQDWFCHTGEERYFDELSKYATCTWQGRCIGMPPAQPGDIMVFRCNLATGPSPRFNHGCIVTGWPRTLHTFNKRGVQECRPSLHPLTAGTEMAIFDPFVRFHDGGVIEAGAHRCIIGEYVSEQKISRERFEEIERLTKC